MRAARHRERAVVTRDLDEREVDRERVERGHDRVVEKWTVVAVHLLVLRARLGDVGPELHPHVLLREYAVEHAEDRGMREHVRVGERLDPRKRQVVPRLAARSEAAFGRAPLRVQAVERVLPARDLLLRNQPGKDAYSVALEVGREAVELRVGHVAAPPPARTISVGSFVTGTAL